MLAAYERVLPGSGERILDQGLSETRHRHEIERGLLEMQREDMREFHRETKLGLWLAAWIVVFVVIAAIIAAAIGYPLLSGLTLAGLATLAGVFAFRWRTTGGSLPRELPVESDDGSFPEDDRSES